MNAIWTQALTKRYGDTLALTLRVAPGEVHGCLVRSGS
jgi:hypothetical protein